VAVDGRSARRWRVTEGPASRARAHYLAGEFRESRAAAVEALGLHPDDVGLLAVAGRASLELDADDAADYLARLVELDPTDAGAWRDLGGALLARGSVEDADAAFRRALELRPDDVEALVDLGHTAFARGQAGEALAHLGRAAERDPTNLDVLRSLLEMHRRLGQPEQALGVARELAARGAGDVGATLDVAQLSLALGRLDEAADVFRRLRQIDPEPGHEVFAYHGLFAVEMRRAEWRRALDAGIEAARADRHARTTDLIAFAAAQLFGPGERPALSAGEIEGIIAESLAEHRLLHVEPLAF
jgi:tetratricopeptide (TPR) repeat protein